MLDTTSASGILTEAFCIQFPLWFVFLPRFRDWMIRTFDGQDWWEAVGQQRGGKSEWLLFATAFPQHVFAAICLILTRLTGNTSFFVHAILSEWSYEAIDVVNQTRQYFAGDFGDNPDGNKAFAGMILHHAPGIIAILPATIYFQDSQEFRDVVWSLLGWAWFTLIGYLGGKSYRLDDLNERTRYTVLMFGNYLMMCYTRMYLFPVAMYGLAWRHWREVSWVFIALGSIYGLLMSGFNLLYVGVTTERLVKLSFGNAKDQESAARVLRRQTPNFARVGFDVLAVDDGNDQPDIFRSQSAPGWSMDKKGL